MSIKLLTLAEGKGFKIGEKVPSVTFKSLLSPEVPEVSSNQPSGKITVWWMWEEDCGGHTHQGYQPLGAKLTDLTTYKIMLSLREGFEYDPSLGIRVYPVTLMIEVVKGICTEVAIHDPRAEDLMVVYT